MYDTRRLLKVGLIGFCAILVIWIVSTMFHHKPSVYQAGASGTYAGQTGSGANSGGSPETKAVPWDYRVEQRTVGDRINGDIALLPDNQLLPNDGNYATGNTIWVLESMDAIMTARSNGSNDVRLTDWKPIKSYTTQELANEDLAHLKEEVQASVDLIGVYKTELDGKFREFAVIKLPSGGEVKQPIDENRYASFKDKKQVEVNLEIVHSTSNYDLALPKFRGWSS